MNEQQVVRENSLVDLLFYCLDRWRCILVIMLIAGILAGAYKYQSVVRSNRSVKQEASLDSEDEEGWACEGRRYYFNIVGKYGAPVQTLLKKVAKLDVACICPLHGPVLNENLEYYVNLYDTWSSYRPEDKGIFIACASIHGNTAAAAEKLAEILRQKGAEKVVVRDLARFDMGEAVEDAFRYDRMILAAASYDGGVFPCMQDFLHHLQSKAYQNRKVGILENGSWAPSAAKTMKGILETMKNVTVVEPAVTIRSTLKEADLPMLEKLADAMV